MMLFGKIAFIFCDYHKVAYLGRMNNTGSIYGLIHLKIKFYNMMYSYFFWISLFFYAVVVSTSCSSPQSKPTQNQGNNAQSTAESEANEVQKVALSQAALEGKTLFKINCAQCHLMTNEDLIGPGMKGITEKHKQDWIVSFIKNSQAMIAAGDEKAIAIYEKYYKTVMPSFNFDETEINQLLAYLKEGGE